MSFERLEEMHEWYRQKYLKAMSSRDPKIVSRIKHLEDKYWSELAELEDKAEKTMDPKLRKEWKLAHKKYKEYTDAIARKLN